MRKPKIFTKPATILFCAVIGICLLALTGHAHAQNFSVPVSVNWTDGVNACDGSVNGQSQDYYYAVAGDSVTFNITNASQYPMDINISETGQTAYNVTLQPGGTASPSFPVNAQIDLMADGTPGDPCQSGHGGPGHYFVEAASGTVTCSLSNNQAWTLQLNFSGITNSLSVNKNGVFVENLNPPGSYFNGPIGFNADAAAATFTINETANGSSRQIGQVGCPAKTVAAPVTLKPSTNQPPTTPTTTSPSASAPVAPNQSTPAESKSNPSSVQTQATASTTAKTLSTKLDRYMAIGVPVTLSALISVWILNLFGIRLKIDRLIKRLRHKTVN